MEIAVSWRVLWPALHDKLTKHVLVLGIQFTLNRNIFWFPSQYKAAPMFGGTLVKTLGYP